MVTSGTGHDRCPSRPGPIRRPDATFAVATKELENPNLVSRGDKKIFGGTARSGWARAARSGWAGGARSGWVGGARCGWIAPPAWEPAPLNKIAKTTPCTVRLAPARGTRAAPGPGARGEKWVRAHVPPDLIPAQVQQRPTAPHLHAWEWPTADASCAMRVCL